LPGISRNDAIEATQYAIWRYTDLDFDAPWAWETADSEKAYRYLLAGANASTRMTPSEAATTISISAPSTPQDAGTLVGPFVVKTNRPTVSVSVDPAATLTDVDGAVLDPDSVVDGQALYLDLRDTNKSGSATIKAKVAGSAVTGHIVSVPTTPGGTPTAADHAQSIILVAPSSATTSAEAVARWNDSGDDGTTDGGDNGTTRGDSATGGDSSTGGDSGTTGGDTTGSTTCGATPSASPSVSDSPTPGGPMAETGSSGTRVIAGIAAALVLVGGGALFAFRRRRSARH
jgi:LPXTG-motif cell wall-anchored protein